MSASICFLTSGLFKAGFLLFNWPSRIANVLYLLKSVVWSNSMVTFCARAPGAKSNPNENKASASSRLDAERRNRFFLDPKQKRLDTTHLQVESDVVYQGRARFR